MPDLAALLLFFLTVLLMELTPGPNMVWLTIMSASEGRRAGLAATAGIGLGLLTIALASALGLAALVESNPVLFEILRWGGCGFLLFLAWEGWREAGESSAARIGKSSARHAFHGFTINVLNPKAAIFYVSVLPQFIDRDGAIAIQAVFLAILSAIIATFVHLGLVVAASHLHGLIDHPARFRLARRILSVLLAGVALWLLASTAR
ncbi:LysE family translocator [Hyphobacterium sp. HN65]|uniref:LysE family translocator n=1 Tax=Hyphobacterium lacteum TaxID=3116575 RepID=A0ABU7LRV8_9PROT|nr:LysE family translocator [Hyphobacterium sp. HN65]MEE2526647.1 LysE family translocator [Hyphobacterium sp. HN65]